MGEYLEMMQQADIFMHHAVVDPVTGDEEGLPVAILEAMQHRLPVISTQHAGIPDAVVNAVTGYLVEEGDTLGMSERICELANDRNLRERFGDGKPCRLVLGLVVKEWLLTCRGMLKGWQGCP